MVIRHNNKNEEFDVAFGTQYPVLIYQFDDGESDRPLTSRAPVQPRP